MSDRSSRLINLLYFLVDIGYITEIKNDIPNWRGKFGNTSFTQLLQEIYKSDYSGKCRIKGNFPQINLSSTDPLSFFQKQIVNS